MLDLPATVGRFSESIPQIGWTRDHAIVALSARLSIALIPIAMIWLRAIRFARWMVLALALSKLAGAPAVAATYGRGEALDPVWASTLGLSLTAAALLFAPGANRWFARRGPRNGESTI